MTPSEFSILINYISVALAENLNNNQLSLLAAALVQIGDTLASIAVQRDIAERNKLGDTVKDIAPK